jgi:hypothetical protein
MAIIIYLVTVLMERTTSLTQGVQSPNFNQIEQVIAKRKAMRRKARARTVEALKESLANCWTGLAALNANATFATAAIAGQGEPALTLEVSYKSAFI